MRDGRPGVLVAALLALASAAYGLTAHSPAGAADERLQIRTLSNRADLISSGDALVEIVVPRGASARGLRVAVNGRDTTRSFAVRSGTMRGRAVGLVSGLRAGKNTVAARLADGRGARLVVTNHHRGGPVFSGPQVQPWICTTEENGLGPPKDAKCNGDTVHTYQYKSAATGQFMAYDPESPPPSGMVAQTTTDEGKTVPYIVRVERGTLNRAIYDFAVLAEPGKQPQPWASPAAWNHKLGFSFGGGCSPAHSQASAQSALNDMMLSRGFAVGVSTLNVFGNGCNLYVSAETMMMIKERITETLGEIRYTIGNGCSGGAEAQHSIAENFPGLLDGIRPECTFADGWTPAFYDKGDCPLLIRYFTQTSPHLWASDTQRAAVTGGHPTSSVCFEMEALGSGRDVWEPTTGCGFDGEAWVYDPETNPEGTRCTMQDYNVAALGRRKDGFANGVIDYEGLQWGLHALYAGTITPEQFVDLNEKIGGWDIDYQWQPQRSRADVAGIRRMYETGQLTYGRNLAKVPSIDARTDFTVDFHSNVHREVVRARLQSRWGKTDSQVFWFEPHPVAFGLPTPVMSERTFEVVDAWLAAIEKDDSRDPIEAKVVRHKPAEAVDGCFLAGQSVLSEDACEAAYGDNVLPRMVAGQPLGADILKCARKPMRRADYAEHRVYFTPAQWDRLKAAFPTGVCDWTKPGVGQRAPRGSWITLAEGPGGRPLGPAPRSRPVG